MAAGIADDVRNTPVWEQKAAAAGTAGSMSMLKVLSEEELCEIVRKEHIRELKAKMQNAASQTGKLAGVGRMVSRSGDTSQFFLDTVRKYRREIASWNIFLSRALRR